MQASGDETPSHQNPLLMILGRRSKQITVPIALSGLSKPPLWASLAEKHAAAGLTEPISGPGLISRRFW